jgi:hypothetical protein
MPSESPEGKGGAAMMKSASRSKTEFHREDAKVAKFIGK